MGAGASFDGNLASFGASTAGDRYFCHSCHRVFGLGGIDNPRDYYCPHCQSTFLEELGNEAATRHNEQISVRHRMHGELNSEQSRRLSNATAMLRLLEAQLRDELENLHAAFENANLRLNGSSREKQKKLTKTMIYRLKSPRLNLDMVCSQPSCPICSDDFVLGSEDAVQLPCSHLFHKACVMPWLDLKQNCPICRAELSDVVVPAGEIESMFSEVELKDKLTELFEVDVAVMEHVSRPGLAAMLHQKLSEQKELDAAESVSSSSSSPSQGMSASNSGASIFLGLGPLGSGSHSSSRTWAPLAGGSGGLGSGAVRSTGGESLTAGFRNGLLAPSSGEVGTFLVSSPGMHMHGAAHGSGMRRDMMFPSQQQPSALFLSSQSGSMGSGAPSDLGAYVRISRRVVEENASSGDDDDDDNDEPRERARFSNSNSSARGHEQSTLGAEQRQQQSLTSLSTDAPDVDHAVSGFRSMVFGGYPHAHPRTQLHANNHLRPASFSVGGSGSGSEFGAGGMRTHLLSPLHSHSMEVFGALHGARTDSLGYVGTAGSGTTAGLRAAVSSGDMNSSSTTPSVTTAAASAAASTAHSISMGPATGRTVNVAPSPAVTYLLVPRGAGDATSSAGSAGSATAFEAVRTATSFSGSIAEDRAGEEN